MVIFHFTFTFVLSPVPVWYFVASLTAELRKLTLEPTSGFREKKPLNSDLNLQSCSFPKFYCSLVDYSELVFHFMTYSRGKQTLKRWSWYSLPLIYYSVSLFLCAFCFTYFRTFAYKIGRLGNSNQPSFKVS